MLESLEAHCRVAKTITVLALDDNVRSFLSALGRPEWRVIGLSDLRDDDLMTLHGKRRQREFCWTCTPALSHRMVLDAEEGDIVVYLDADLRFFAAPELLLDELGPEGSILIHEHRFSADRQRYEATSGRFNVGFVAFRVTEEARACVKRWRSQVLETCVLDPDNGLCGDQGYLNEWPKKYPGLRIMENIGGGVAPWNLNSYVLTGSRGTPRVDGVPVVFFHYHSFRSVAVSRLGTIAAIPAHGYDFPTLAKHLFFSDYARALRRLSKSAARHGFAVAADVHQPFREALSGWRRGSLILSL